MIFGALLKAGASAAVGMFVKKGKKAALKWAYRHKTGIFEAVGLKWMVDEEGSLRVWKNGTYAAGSLQAILPRIQPDDIVADIGAAYGWFAMQMAKKAKHVYAYEPDHDLYDMCEFNAHSNDIENITIKNVAVMPGVHMQQRTLYRDTENATGGRMFDEEVSRDSVRSVDTVDINREPGFSVIKIDTEGMDFAILKNLQIWPRIVLCKWNMMALLDHDKMTSPLDYLDFLQKRGDVYEIQDDPPQMRFLRPEDFPASKSCDLMVIKQ